jgi:hypothetical protein
MKKTLIASVLLLASFALKAQTFPNVDSVKKFINDSIRSNATLKASTVKKAFTSIAKFLADAVQDTTSVSVKAHGIFRFQRKDSTLYMWDTILVPKRWRKAILLTLQSVFDAQNGYANLPKDDTIAIGVKKFVISNNGHGTGYAGIRIDFTQDGSSGTTDGIVTLESQSLQGVAFGARMMDPGFTRNQVENTNTPTVSANVGISYVSTAAGFTSKLTFANVIAQWFLAVKGSPFTGDSALMIRTTSAGIINAVDNLGYIMFRGSPFANTNEYARFAATTGYLGLNTTTPAYRLDVNGKAIFRDSAWAVTPGVNDSTTRIATTQWVKQQAYGTGGGGGGGGSGTVNSGSQYRVAYYATAGTAVSEGNAITANRALISDANGVPVHSSVTNTELGYVSGVSSAIQTQFSNKQALNTHLTTISGLTPTNDDIMQYKSGAWSNRTIAQLKTDLGLSNSNNGDQTLLQVFALSNYAPVLTHSVFTDISTKKYLIGGVSVSLEVNDSTGRVNLAGGRIYIGGSSPTGSNGTFLEPNALTGTSTQFKLAGVSSESGKQGRIENINNGYGITYSANTVKVDTATVFPAVRATIPPGGGGSGVTGVGTINSLTPAANGAGVSGSNLILQTVTGSVPGLMTSAQKARLDSNYNIVTPVTGTQVAKVISADSLRIKSIVAGNSVTVTNNSDSTITIGTTFNPTVQSLTDGATISWNVTSGGNASVILGATGRTLSISNPVAGHTYTIRVIQDGVGSKTITTWPTNTKWPGNGTAPTLTTTPSRYDIITFYYDGTNYYGNYNTNYN